MNTLHVYRCVSCDAEFEFEARKLPKAIPCPSCGAEKTQRAKSSGGRPTGTYKFSEALQTVVKVSASVPGLKKSGSGPEPGGSCPPQGCGRCR